MYVIDSQLDFLSISNDTFVLQQIRNFYCIVKFYDLWIKPVERLSIDRLPPPNTNILNEA